MAAPDAPPTPFSMLLDFLKEKLGTQTGELISFPPALLQSFRTARTPLGDAQNAAIRDLVDLLDNNEVTRLRLDPASYAHLVDIVLHLNSSDKQQRCLYCLMAGARKLKDVDQVLPILTTLHGDRFGVNELRLRRLAMSKKLVPKLFKFLVQTSQPTNLRIVATRFLFYLLQGDTDSQRYVYLLQDDLRHALAQILFTETNFSMRIFVADLLRDLLIAKPDAQSLWPSNVSTLASKDFPLAPLADGQWLLRLMHFLELMDSRRAFRHESEPKVYRLFVVTAETFSVAHDKPDIIVELSYKLTIIMPADRDMCVEMIEVPLVQNMTWGSNKDEGSQESKILGQVHGIILSFKNNAGNLFTKGRKHALNHLRLFFENEERCSAFEKTLEDTIKRGDLETRSSEQGYNAELDDNRRRHSNTVFFDLSQGKAEDEADENTRDLSVLEMPASTVGETRQKDWPPRKLVDKSLADGHLQEFESLLLEDKAVGIAGVAEIMESSQDVAETVYVNHSPRGGTVDSQQTTRSRPRSQQPGQDAKVDITSAVVHGGKEQGKKQGKAAQIYPANSNTTHVTDSYDTSDDTSFPPDAVQHLQRSSGVREGVSTNDIAENMQTLVQNQMETPASEALTTHDISRPEIDPHIAASISSVIADHTNRDSPLRPAQAHSKPQVALPPLNESSLPEADGRISSETTQFPFLPRSEGNHCGLKRPLLARIGPVDEDDVDWDQDLRDSASDIDPPKSKRNKVTKSKSKKSTGRGASSKQKIVVTAARPAGRASATAGARMMKTKKAHDQVEQTLASTRARRTVAKTSAKVAEGAQFDIENERQSSPLLQDTDQSVEPEQRIGLDGIIQMEDSQSQGNGRASSLEDHSHSVLDDVIITSRRSELLVEDSADISILPVNNVPSNRTSKLLPWNRELSEDRAGSDDQQDTGELGITFEKAMQDLDLFRDRQPVAAAEHTGSAHDSQPLDTTEHLKLLDQPTTTFGTKMTQLLKEIALVPEQPTERASTPPFGDPKAFVELVNTTKSSSHQKPRPHEFAPAIRPDMLPSMSAKSVPRTVDEQRTCSKQPAGSFARGAEQDESAAPTLGPIYISSDRESEASEAALVDPSNCAQESLVNKKVPTGSERINDELGTRASKRDNRYSLADKSQQLRTSAEDNIMTSPPFSPKRVSAKKVTFQATRTAGEAEDPSQENLQNAATDSNEAVQEDVSPKKMDDDADPAALDKSLTDRINSPQGASLAKSPPSNKLGAGGVYPDRVRETRHIAPQLNLEGHRTPNGPVSHVSDLALVLTDERKHRKTQITSLSAKRPRNQAVVSPVKRDKRSPSSGRAPAGNPKHHAFKAQQHIQATQADREFQRVPIASAVPQCNEASGKYWDEPSDGIFAREESADEHLLVERNPAKETGQNACQGSKVDENGSPRLRGSPESPSSAQALPSPLKQPSFVASRIDQSPMFIRGLDIRGARKAGCNSAAASLPEHSDLGPSPSPHTAFAVTTGMAKSRSSIGLSIVMDRNFPSASTTMNTDAFKLPKASSTFHNTNTTLVVKTSSDDAVMTEHTPDTQMRDTSETGERKASPFHFKDIDTTLPSTRSTAAPIIVRRLRPTSPFATIADAQNEDVTPLSFNTRVQNMMPPPAKPAHAIILDLRSKRGRTTARPDAEDADLTLVEAESFAQHAGVRTIRQVRNDRSSESSQESHSSPASATSHQLKRRQEDLNLWRTKVRSTYQKLGDIATEITNTLLFRLRTEEDAIESKVQDYQRGGNSVIDSFTAAYDDYVCHEKARSAPQVRELHRRILASYDEREPARKRATSGPSLHRLQDQLEKREQSTLTEMEALTAEMQALWQTTT